MQKVCALERSGAKQLQSKICLECCSKTEVGFFSVTFGWPFSRKLNSCTFWIFCQNWNFVTLGLFPRWIWISQYYVFPFYVFIDSIKLAKWMRDKCFIFISISQCLCHFMPHHVNIYVRSSLWLGKHHDIFSALCKFCWSINGFIISINILDFLHKFVVIYQNFPHYWIWLDFFIFKILFLWLLYFDGCDLE